MKNEAQLPGDGQREQPLIITADVQTNADQLPVTVTPDGEDLKLDEETAKLITETAMDIAAHQPGEG